MEYTHSSNVVLCSQFVVAEKRPGDLTIEFPCDEIDRFCRALIAGDKPKRGANDLCGYKSY